MKTIVDKSRAARLRGERERLQLSQAEFAAKMGVSRVSQVNYELGKRSPDWSYLDAAGELGVDIGYLLFGEKSAPSNLQKTAVARLLPFFSGLAKIDLDALVGVIDIAIEDEANAWRNERERLVSDDNMGSLIFCLFEFRKLFGDVFRHIQEAEQKLSTKLPPEKKARVALALYSAFADSRKIDKRTVETTVKVALSEAKGALNA